MGLRLNELVQLRIRDFEPNHDPINKIGLIRIQGKGKKERALFVVDKLYDNLCAYLEHPQSPKKKLDPLFPAVRKEAKTSTKRPPLLHSGVQRMIHKHAQNANIKCRITPVVLRHSFASELYTAGVPIDAIKTMLGHQRIADTAIYIHISDHIQQHAIDQITIEGKPSWKL